jgi:hypothetical protein
MSNSLDRDTKLSRKAAQIIGRQEGIQNQADCVALYVSAAAGYSPQAYANFLTVRREQMEAVAVF